MEKAYQAAIEIQIEKNIKMKYLPLKIKEFHYFSKNFSTFECFTVYSPSSPSY